MNVGPSEENYKTFIKKVKTIVNNSGYGAKVKSAKLTPIVRGWRNYHKYCNMNGSRYSLWFTTYRTYRVFLKQKSIDRYEAEQLVKTAFPAVSWKENKFINVKGDKSPYDGDITYWSERECKLYDSISAQLIKKQKHTCGVCGMKFLPGEDVHLHHIDENHNNWKRSNLMVVHHSCHHYIHMSKSTKKKLRIPRSRMLGNLHLRI